MNADASVVCDTGLAAEPDGGRRGHGRKVEVRLGMV